MIKSIFSVFLIYVDKMVDNFKITYLSDLTSK